MNNYVGEIILGTKVNNKGLTEGLNKVKSIAEKFDKNNDIETNLEVNASFDEQSLKSLSYVLNWTINELNEQAKITPSITEKKFLTDSALLYNKALEEVKKLNEAYKINPSMSEEDAIGYLLNMNKYINQAERLDDIYDNIHKKHDNIDNSIKKVLRSVGKWALALVGVRSAINLIRSSFSTLSQYNDELANKMANIKLVLATALEPIIMRIVSWIQTMVTYLNYLTNAWFGLNLFARASELTTKKMADNLSAGASAAKDIRKQLAGFDEMNVLGDNVASAGGGGISGSQIPEFNLDPNIEIPEWLVWIKDNGPTIASILGAIAAGFVAIKIATFIEGLLGATEGMLKFNAAIGLIAGGVVLLASNIINLVLNWDEMDNKQKALAIGLAALGAAMITLGVSMATGFSAATLGIGALVAAVVGLIGWLTAIIIKDKEERDALMDVNYYQKEYNKAKQEAQQALDEYATAVERAEETEQALNEAQIRTGLSGAELNKQVLDGTLKYKEMTKEQREVWKAYRDNEAAQKNLTEKTEKMNKEVLNSQLAASLAEKDYKKYGETLENGMKKGIINSDDMSKQIIKDMKGMDDKAKKTFAETLPENIKNAFDWDTYGSKLKTFKKNWDDYINELNKNIQIKATIQYRIMTDDNYTGSGSTRMMAKGGIINLPRLATGAIINRPGIGIPVAGAIAGEAGREGILPLTDYQAMETLGREIGKWISINATIPVQIGNRQIARVMEELGQQRAFAKND